MKRINFLLNILSLMFLFLLYNPVSASYPGGQFLKIGISPKAIAMGNAQSAVVDDITAIYWNPAGLTGIKTKQVYFQYMYYILDVQRHYLSYGMLLSEKESLSFDVSYLYSPDNLIDSNGNTYGSFTDYYMNVTCAYARKFSEKLSVGCGFKYINTQLYQDSTRNTGLDIGLLYILNDKINLGLVLQNNTRILEQITSMLFESDLFKTDEKETIPMIIRLGIGYKLKENVLVAVDFSKASDDDAHISLGSEYSATKLFAVRLGYENTNSNINGLSAGFGIKWKENSPYKLDYSITPTNDLGLIQNFSIKFTF